jgi:hypothetical protein
MMLQKKEERSLSLSHTHTNTYLLRRELSRRSATFRLLRALLLEAASADPVLIAELLELTRPPVVEAVEVRLL